MKVIFLIVKERPLFVEFFYIVLLKFNIDVHLKFKLETICKWFAFEPEISEFRKDKMNELCMNYDELRWTE